ncbi:MAG: acetyltransferase [Polyangiales bacterium]
MFDSPFAHEARRLLLASLALGLTACVDGLPPPDPEPAELAVGESRDVELRFLRFDVTDFEQTLTREDILAFPRDVQDRLWLLDLDLRSGPTTPRLLDSALEAIKDVDPAELSPAARNMQALLRMTPETAQLEGTALEQLIGLAPLLGLAPAQVLADLLGVDVEDEILTPAAVSQTVLENVIAVHPNTQTRLGPRTADNPDGIYPVTPGTLPLTLADAADNFASLSRRYGPVFIDGVYHPGFISGASRARVLEDGFSITVRANANALPYKGVDLSNGGVASVNSVRSQIEDLFDFGDPRWLTIDGLVPGDPVIEELTFRMVEDERFIFGGRAPLPAGEGDSFGWTLPRWTLEYVILSGARSTFASQSASVSYRQPDREDPLFLAQVVDGYQSIDVVGGVGAPPAASYLWDLLLEVAQTRLHDGGLAEGDADVEFTLRDVPVGTDTALIEQTMRDNLASDPNSLLDIAQQLIDSTRGEADFYYVRSEPREGAAEGEDWLFYVEEDDIARGDDGQLVRPYDYANPGFFADAALQVRVSSRDAAAGDARHEKVRVTPGDVLYVAGTGTTVYQLEVLDKPSLGRIAIRITRVR